MSGSPEINTVLLSLASSIVGGTIVAAMNHLLTRHREKERKLGDIRIQYLIEAWKNIEKATNIESASDRDKDALYDNLESAFASVILLGDQEEIRAANELVQQDKNGAGTPSPDDLLRALRRSLRRELGIEDGIQGHIFLRVHRDQKMKLTLSWLKEQLDITASLADSCEATPRRRFADATCAGGRRHTLARALRFQAARFPDAGGWVERMIY